MKTKEDKQVRDMRIHTLYNILKTVQDMEFMQDRIYLNSLFRAINQRGSGITISQLSKNIHVLLRDNFLCNKHKGKGSRIKFSIGLTDKGANLLDGIKVLFEV